MTEVIFFFCYTLTVNSAGLRAVDLFNKSLNFHSFFSMYNANTFFFFFFFFKMVKLVKLAFTNKC